jgi:hypothetical protein
MSLSNYKTTFATGRRGCEAPMLPNFVGNLLADKGEVVCLMRRPHFTPSNNPGARFFKRMSQPKTVVRLEGLGLLKKKVTSSAFEPKTFRLVSVRQPTALPRASLYRR